MCLCFPSLSFTFWTQSLASTGEKSQTGGGGGTKGKETDAKSEGGKEMPLQAFEASEFDGDISVDLLQSTIEELAKMH